MKRILKIAAVALVIMLGSSWRNSVSAQGYDNDYYEDDYSQDGYYQDDEVSYQTFYDELSPYGRWIDYPQHGYVWVPNVGAGFRPYATNGHWVWTDGYEWMWVSDYDWGWAPFHYGRWLYDPFYGWVWVPGYEWSPAWVVWRHGGDYYGWAPLRPGIHISINFSIGSYSPPYDYWCFAPRRYITSYNVYNHCFDRRQNVTIINQTTIINNYNYNNRVFRTGPQRYEAERYVGRINPVRFRESSRPGRTTFRNNEVNVYRPSVRQDQGRRIAPRSFERYDRQQTNGNNNRFERNGNQANTNDRRFDRNSTRPDRQVERNNNSGNTNDRRFDRNSTRSDRQVERNNNRRDNNIENRSFENRGNGNGQVRERPGSSPFERRSNEVRQPQRTDNGAIEQRRREMNERRNTQIERQRNEERTFRQQQPQGQPQGNPGGNRQFERRSAEGNNSGTVRQQQREVRMERPSQQIERRPQQVERSPQASQPQPQRQFERRDNGNSQQQSSGNGGSNGRGRGNGRGRD